MKKWMICIGMISSFFLLYIGLTFIDGFYMKSDYRIGNDQVYTYKPNHIIRPDCKGFEVVTIFENEHTLFYLQYHCDNEGYFIRYKWEYIRLNQALELGIITEDEIRNSGIRVLERQKSVT